MSFESLEFDGTLVSKGRLITPMELEEVFSRRGQGLNLLTGWCLCGDTTEAMFGASHQVGIRYQAGTVKVQLGSRSWLDRDFVLLLRDLENLSSAIIAEDQLEPGVSVVMASYSPTINAEPHPVAVKLLVDCSGSMAGDSIKAAKRALAAIVSGLTQQDRFTLSRFGSFVDPAVT